MLSKLVIKNFKSIGEKGIDLELKPLTILVGPNGAGKSSVLESLALLAANVGTGEFRLNGELVHFNAYEEIAHKHHIGQWMVWEIGLSGNVGVRYEHRPDSGEEKETVLMEGKESLQFSLEGHRLEGKRLFVSLPGKDLKVQVGNSLVRLDGRKYNSATTLQGLADAGRRSRRMNLPVEPNAVQEKPYPELDAAAKALERLGTYLQEQLFLLSALRGEVAAQSTTGQIPRWCGLRGEGLLTLLAMVQGSSVQEYEDKWGKIQFWANEFGLLKLKAGLRGANVLAADFLDRDLKTTVNLAFAGQGSRQILSVITQLFWARPGSLIMIEEPEISLHPEAQVKLGEMFADAIHEGKQIMATTHSHFLLLALSRAVEKGLKVDDIAVYHVTKGKEGTEAKPVPLNKRGYPLGWPPSYEKVERDVALNWAKGLAKE
ncbi:MAG: AAA family ATPase [Chloroflexi bacterium]|nr:AAA family ATPase [Chloroflexota bacterium]